MGKEIVGVSFKAAGGKGVTLTYNNFDNEGSLGNTTKNYKRVPHADFMEALQRLKVHALFKVEEMKVASFKKAPELAEDDVLGKNFRVCGVHIKGAGDNEGYVITVYKTLSTGEGFVFNTPFIRVESKGDTAYKFIEQLMNDIEGVKKEAEAYLQGKFGVTQGELFEKVEEPAEAVGE